MLNRLTSYIKDLPEKHTTILTLLVAFLTIVLAMLGLFLLTQLLPLRFRLL